MPRRPMDSCCLFVAAPVLAVRCSLLARPEPNDFKPSATLPRCFDLATASGLPWPREIFCASVLLDASFGFEQPKGAVACGLARQPLMTP